MQMQIKTFPPLYVGAGVGANWNSAKGKYAEIHPTLGQTYIEEAHGQANQHSLFRHLTFLEDS